MYESEAGAQPPYWLTIFLCAKYIRALGLPPVLEAAEHQNVKLDIVKQYMRLEGHTY